MPLFKKKKPEEQPGYAEQKKASEDNTVERVNIGGEKTNNEPEVSINDVVLGMTDNEYRAQIIAILMEIHDAVKPK
jgi:hypothetical protein